MQRSHLQVHTTKANICHILRQLYWQEAALLKIPMAVKSCSTGSCQHPLTTASSAESCLKTHFLQATFTVCCHKVLFLLSQQTNVWNFLFLGIGITFRRTRVKHPMRNIFSPFFGRHMARGKKIINHVFPSAVTFKLWHKQQWSILHKYFLLYYFPNKMALKQKLFPIPPWQIKDTFP